METTNEPTRLVKQIEGTPFTIVTLEEKTHDNIMIVIGNTIITQNYESEEEAMLDIQTNWIDKPILTNSIIVIAKGVYEHYEEIKKEEEKSKNKEKTTKGK